MSTTPADDRTADHWQGADATTYRITRAVGLRVLGPVCMVLGVVWLVVALTGFVTWAAGLAVVLSVILALAVVRMVVVPPVLVRLDRDGFQVRAPRGGTPSHGSWSEVVSVGEAELGGSPCLVIQTSPEHASVVPMPLVGERRAELQAEVRQRLNTAHGYRPLS